MLDWLKPKSTRQERDLARRAQMRLATRVSFADSPRQDPDSLVGEAVYESEVVIEALMELVSGTAPRRPLQQAAADALTAMSPLVALRPSWIAYCNRRFGLDPEVTDAQSEMCRLWVDSGTARSWPDFERARSTVIVAREEIAKLQTALAEFTSSDVTALA
ncbi:hypothetical protein ABT288_12670 [Streptomyces sp. NPDC001093]|uniref:hypothetical protein n=1 Tax=Streptomyces sp. NPDC001093 TaxID=3154376 RepID=UPI0033197708